VHRLDEMYPEHFTSHIEISPHFQWQINDLIEYLCGHRDIRREGVLFLADGLSEADEQWLDGRMIDWRVWNLDDVD